MSFDLQKLLERENYQVEWKEGVADSQDTARTLVAFANDFQGLGGGYLVCGARESRNEHGFPVAEVIGLTASEISRIVGELQTIGRDNVNPPIFPSVAEIDTHHPDKKVVIFTQPRTGQAHSFKAKTSAPAYWIRSGSMTCEARNGALRELLVKNGAAPPWELQACAESTSEDIDRLKLRSFLSKLGRDQQDPERFVSATEKLHALVEPLLLKEPLSGMLRPRNFAILLFGKDIHRFFPNAYIDFAVYPEFDRASTNSTRTALTGDLFEQIDAARKHLALHNPQQMDKSDRNQPNFLSYPVPALEEALVNAVVHRDYSIRQPISITVFLDRIEFRSPGALSREIDKEQFTQGTAGPFWRNRSLSWFTSELQYTQAQGQGIPTIIKTLKRAKNKPQFDFNGNSLNCIIPADARHTQLQLLHQNLQHLLNKDIPASLELLEEASNRHHNCKAAWQQLAESLGQLRGILPYSPTPSQINDFGEALLEIVSAKIVTLEVATKLAATPETNFIVDANDLLKRTEADLASMNDVAVEQEQLSLCGKISLVQARIQKILEWIQTTSHKQL
jgi:ATP-dependent DNA helicase RecG